MIQSGEGSRRKDELFSVLLYTKEHDLRGTLKNKVGDAGLFKEESQAHSTDASANDQDFWLFFLICR